ncbi:MAG: ribonuclease H-like domain-containing protein [Candidatus Acidiferrales bacterium]
MSKTLPDRFARVKALEKPSNVIARNSWSSRQTAKSDQLSEGLFEERPGHSPNIPDGAERLAELLGAQLVQNEYGEHLALRKWFSDVVNGVKTDCPPLGHGVADERVDASALRLLVPGAPEVVADPRQWLFLDTETTGIMGGTGTYPFMVGIAWWDAGGLEVEQFFMRDHGDEHALLVTLAERMAERRVLVTFNGKSFDWPLLETRYRMTRKLRPPTPTAHLDFLHPARNLWRVRIGSVRLWELERHVLGWNRGPDLVSELIPEIYFDFLRGGPPEPLVPIFLHNQMDLRGLAALSSRIVSLLAEHGREKKDGFELFGLSRICERRGETKRARQHYEQSIALSELSEESDRAAKKSLARLAKRGGDLTLARDLWEGMLGHSREGVEAYEQLAIYYERHSGETERAAETSRGALKALQQARRLGVIGASAYQQLRGRFERRLARVERKAANLPLKSIVAESTTQPNESNNREKPRGMPCAKRIAGAREPREARK